MTPASASASASDIGSGSGNGSGNGSGVTPGLTILIDVCNVTLSAKEHFFSHLVHPPYLDYERLVSTIRSNGFTTTPRALSSTEYDALAFVGARTDLPESIRQFCPPQRQGNMEKAVDHVLVRYLTEEYMRVEILGCRSPGRTFCLVSGDADFIDVVKHARYSGCNVELWFWQRSPAFGHNWISEQSSGMGHSNVGSFAIHDLGRFHEYLFSLVHIPPLPTRLQHQQHQHVVPSPSASQLLLQVPSTTSTSTSTSPTPVSKPWSTGWPGATLIPNIPSPKYVAPQQRQQQQLQQQQQQQQQQTLQLGNGGHGHVGLSRGTSNTYTMTRSPSLGARVVGNNKSYASIAKQPKAPNPSSTSPSSSSSSSTRSSSDWVTVRGRRTGNAGTSMGTLFRSGVGTTSCSSSLDDLSEDALSRLTTPNTPRTSGSSKFVSKTGTARCHYREFCQRVATCPFFHTRSEIEFFQTHHGRFVLGKQEACRYNERCNPSFKPRRVCTFLHSGEDPVCAACLEMHSGGLCIFRRDEVVSAREIDMLLHKGYLDEKKGTTTTPQD